MVICFGAFEVNLSAGEILQHGVKIKLQVQPFQLLTALLERPGEVVSRDELYQRIWATDTFVDFERGLNKAINRVREALGDSSEHPAFIETLSRRGYRFIAPIERKLGSIAVLPLENLSGDPGQEHWADGMTDELIVQLAKIGGLRVISRSSVMRFKRSRSSVRDIARRLGVEAVIEGSVVVSDGRVRIRAQLIEASNERHLWADSYDRELGDVLALQQQIAQAVARLIHARLAPEEEVRLANARRVIPEAYESYVKGRHFWNKRTEPDFDKSIEHFKRAVELDPGYAEPYVGLADAHIMLGIFGLRHPRDLYARAKAAAETALSLDETLGGAHKSLATLRFFYEWDTRGAEQECRRAIELDPNSAISHQWYGIMLACLERHEEAINEMKRARDLDPLSIPINGTLAMSYLKARRYEGAVNACRVTIELDVNNPFGHFRRAYWMQKTSSGRRSRNPSWHARFPVAGRRTGRTSATPTGEPVIREERKKCCVTSRSVIERNMPAHTISL